MFWSFLWNSSASRNGNNHNELRKPLGRNENIENIMSRELSYGGSVFSHWRDTVNQRRFEPELVPKRKQQKNGLRCIWKNFSQKSLVSACSLIIFAVIAAFWAVQMALSRFKCKMYLNLVTWGLCTPSTNFSSKQQSSLVRKSVVSFRNSVLPSSPNSMPKNWLPFLRVHRTIKTTKCMTFLALRQLHYIFRLMSSILNICDHFDYYFLFT